MSQNHQRLLDIALLIVEAIKIAGFPIAEIQDEDGFGRRLEPYERGEFRLWTVDTRLRVLINNPRSHGEVWDRQPSVAVTLDTSSVEGYISFSLRSDHLTFTAEGDGEIWAELSKIPGWEIKNLIEDPENVRSTAPMLLRAIMLFLKRFNS